jgi:ferredoxin
MMESLVPALEAWGVPKERIHFEAFGPASIKRSTKPPAVPAPETTRTVTFARSGRQLQWQASDGSLLELAEANGVKVNSGCRAGGCGACQTTIRSGEVAYRHAPDFDPEPGTCLLCVCIPKSDVTLEA